MTTSSCTVREADWHHEPDLLALRAVRYAVFVLEQNVPAEMEWTGDDDDCLHALAVDGDGNTVGTARLDNDGHIGRMAVLHSHRGIGAGRELLRYLIARARKRGDPEVHLDAQTHALGFYRREGFEAFGPEIVEAGIPHRAMLLTLK